MRTEFVARLGDYMVLVLLLAFVLLIIPSCLMALHHRHMLEAMEKQHIYQLDLLTLTNEHERTVEEFRANVKLFLLDKARELLDAVLLCCEGSGSMQRLEREK